jgi:hypothetical protein
MRRHWLLAKFNVVKFLIFFKSVDNQRNFTIRQTRRKVSLLEVSWPIEIPFPEERAKIGEISPLSLK